ncbi:MAG: hypothetical protein L0Z50_18650 [Verrucomicrobiales bacterium]|nr:hypothetical protein [Verrucomicrobiales bacterium]
MNGNPTPAWNFEALAQKLRRRAAERAQQLGYRDVEALLSAPVKEWQLPIPENEIAAEYVQQAITDLQTLAPAVAAFNDVGISEGDFYELVRTLLLKAQNS